MAKSGMAGQDRGCEPIGDEHPRSAVMGGGLVTRTAPLCALCALLGEWHKKSKDGQAPGRARHGMQIALVDDDAEALRAARHMLQGRGDGWSVDAFSPCGAAPVRPPARATPVPASPEPAQPPASPPDVLVVGAGNGARSPFGCLRKVKRVAPHLPVLIISGRCSGESILQWLVAGAHGCLFKPLAPELLARAVSSVVEGRRALCPQLKRWC